VCSRARGDSSLNAIDEELPDVDVVIVAHNGGVALRTAVQSIQESHGVRPNVVVVDNSSSDGSIDALDKKAVTVIRLPQNIGYGAGFNVGLGATTSQWVACSNQDIVLDRDALRVLIATAAESEETSGTPAVVGPRIVRPDGSTTETCHAIPSLGQECLRLLFSARVSRNIIPIGDGPATRWIRCGWVSAVFIVGRRSLFERVGGFDPDYFMYVEDLDLFRRLRDAGACCLWEPRVSVVHSGGIDPTTRGAVSGEMYALTLWNIRRYFKQFEPDPSGLKGAAVLGAGLVGATLRASLWSGRALWARCSRSAGGVRSESADGLARMFSTGAYLSAIALVTGRVPKRVRQKIGRT
jgi:N-acetylglucosaminyl-diphospho-decaprenol L-rhamnosyltransferase